MFDRVYLPRDSSPTEFLGKPAGQHDCRCRGHPVCRPSDVFPLVRGRAWLEARAYLHRLHTLFFSFSFVRGALDSLSADNSCSSRCLALLHSCPKRRRRQGRATAHPMSGSHCWEGVAANGQKLLYRHSAQLGMKNLSRCRGACCSVRCSPHATARL